MTRVRISAGQVTVMATLFDSDTARKIEAACPLESGARRWGDEVYFEVPVEAGEENARADVPEGAVAYWPPGKALCLFFGQRPYSPVNIIGNIDGDPNVLTAVQDGDAVRVEAI